MPAGLISSGLIASRTRSALSHVRPSHSVRSSIGLPTAMSAPAYPPWHETNRPPREGAGSWARRRGLSGLLARRQGRHRELLTLRAHALGQTLHGLLSLLSLLIGQWGELPAWRRSRKPALLRGLLHGAPGLRR